MKQRYVEKSFKSDTLRIIEQANTIIAAYQAQGFVLTLRQLYYQFVSRDLLANTVQNYKRLGTIVNDARLAGLIDWDAIEDRTRNLSSLTHWSSPQSILDAVAQQYRSDKWRDQPYRVEVWIEKEALAGVFERVCQEHDVPFFCCRGYTSQSEMRSAAERLRRYTRVGQCPVILHFGDHDPSGIDMSRDIQERMDLFGARINFNRIALNMDQVEEFDPPPNPAKETDSRFAGYLETYGDESWELDALEPSVLADLVRARVEELRDDAKWEAAEERDHAARSNLELISANYERACEYLAENPDEREEEWH